MLLIYKKKRPRSCFYKLLFSLFHSFLMLGFHNSSVLRFHLCYALIFTEKTNLRLTPLTVCTTKLCRKRQNLLKNDKIWLSPLCSVFL